MKEREKLSSSRISVAKGCWKKYYWRYVEKLKPVSRPSALTLGRLIHEAFDMFYRGESDEGCLKYIVKRFDEEIATAELFDQEDLVIAKYTAIGMWTYYPFKDLNEFDKVESEFEFTVKIPGIRSHLYTGFLDGKITKDNKLFVRECKTSGLNQRQFEGRAKTSHQSTGYMWALRQMGLDPKGIMYDLIRKPRLRKNQREDMNGFGMRIVNDYKERPDHYFARVWSYRSNEELDLFQRDLIAFVRNLRNVKRRGMYYRNTDQCWNFNAECPYSKICFQDTPDPLVLDLLYEKGGDKDDGNKSNEEGKPQIRFSIGGDQGADQGDSEVG